MNQFLLVLSLFMTISCFKGDDDCAPSHQEKVNGLSWVSSNMVVNASHIQPVVNVNANYTALIPFAFLPELNSTEVQEVDGGSPRIAYAIGKAVGEWLASL